MSSRETHSLNDSLSKEDLKEIKSDSEIKSDLDVEGPKSAVKASVFDDDVLGKYFEPPDSWENKHRFDPKATWTEKEEKKVIRKCDFYVCAFACIMFAALQLDRGNIGNALSDNMLKDLGLTTNDYNTGQTIFFVVFLSAELPSQLISKALGVDRWVPFQIVAWSAVAMSQCAIQGKAGFYVTRALLGLLEGGFIPDMVLYLSYFYKQKELDLRLTWFWTAMTLTTIFGNMIAAAILTLRNRNGWEGWRYLFVIEGALTCALGLFSAFWLPPSPTQTKGLLRGKNGWFSEREEVIIVNRVLRDDPSKSDMHNRQAVSLKQLWQSFCDYDMWPLYLIGLTYGIAVSTVASYFSLTMRQLKFTTFETNMLGVPYNVLHIINTFIVYKISRIYQERTFVTMGTMVYQLICFIAVVTIPDSTGPWAKYALLTITLGSPYPHPILVSWTSANSNSVRTRSVAQSLYNMHVQASSIIGSNIYRADDAPYYHRGNKILVGLVALTIFTQICTKIYYVSRNRYRAKKWNAMTLEEKEAYLANPPHQGNKRLDFQLYH